MTTTNNTDPNSPTAYDWLLFDADDTLFDYPKAEFKTLNKAFAQFGLIFKPEYLPAYHHINAILWREFEQGKVTSEQLRTERFDLLFQQFDIPADPELFSPAYLQNLSQATDLIEGAEEIVCLLAQRYRMAIITNGFKDVQRPRVALSTIAAYFPVLVISEEIGFAKPDRRFFDRAFEQIGQPPREKVLLIGDNLSSDIQGGNNYGIDTCWVNPQRKPLPSGFWVKYQILRVGELEQFLIS